MAHYAPFLVTITNVTGAIFDGEASLLTVPSLLGETTILAHHEPLITLLKKGYVRLIDAQGSEMRFDIQSGVLEVSGNKVIVLI